jgi:hypothetical protein
MAKQEIIGIDARVIGRFYIIPMEFLRRSEARCKRLGQTYHECQPVK